MVNVEYIIGSGSTADGSRDRRGPRGTERYTERYTVHSFEHGVYLHTP